MTQRKRNNSESSLKSEASTKAVSSDEHTEEIRAMVLEEEERNDTLSELASSVHPQRTTMSGISTGRPQPAMRAPSSISQVTFTTAQEQNNPDNQAFNQLQHQENIYPSLPHGDVVSSVAESDLRFQQKVDAMNQSFQASPSAISGFSRNTAHRSTIGGRPNYGSGINMGRSSILSAPSQHPVVMRPPSTVHPSDSASNVIGMSENGDPSLIYVPLKQLSQEQQMDEFRKQAHAVWVQNGGRSVVSQQLRPYNDDDGWIFNELTGMFHRAQNSRPYHGHDGRQGQPGRGPQLGQWNMDKELGDVGRKKNPPPGERRGAPQDGNPNQDRASVADTGSGSGSGTPASERAQVKVAGVHWFSCTPSSIAKTWVRTLIVLILTVALIGLLLILANKLGLIKLK